MVKAFFRLVRPSILRSRRRMLTFFVNSIRWKQSNCRFHLCLRQGRHTFNFPQNVRLRDHSEMVHSFVRLSLFPSLQWIVHRCREKYSKHINILTIRPDLHTKAVARLGRCSHCVTAAVVFRTWVRQTNSREAHSFPCGNFALSQRVKGLCTSRVERQKGGERRCNRKKSRSWAPL